MQQLVRNDVVKLIENSRDAIACSIDEMDIRTQKPCLRQEMKG